MVKLLNNTNIVGQSTSLVFKTNINDPIGKWTITVKEPLELYDGITLKVMVTTIPDLNRNTLQFKYGYDMTPEATVYKSPSVPITSEHIDKYAIINLTYASINNSWGWYVDTDAKITFPIQSDDFGKVNIRNGSTVNTIEATEVHDTIGLTAGDNITLEVNEETMDITIISTAVTEVGNLNTLSTESLTPSSGENFSNNIDLHKISKTGNYNDLNNKPTIPTVPTEISAFNNDVGYITLNDVPRQVNADWNADSGVSEILNKPTIHTYTAGEGIEISQNDVISCTVEQDTDHAHLEHLDYESSGHTGFQPTLSSQNAGTDISITVVNGIPKINNTQVPVQPSWGNITGTLSNQTDLQDALNNKQNELIPGTGVNIENDIISVTPPVWGNITGTLANQTDLQNALNAKQDILSSANEGVDISITLVNGVPKINVINIQDDISTINGNISDIVSDISDINSDISDLQSDVGTIQSYIPSNTSSSNQLAVHSDITTIQSNLTSIDGRVITIEGKIPTQASTTNQLADKEFVNSSIATNTANFIGTFSNVSSLLAYSGILTNNDYAFVMNSVITNNGSDWTTFSDLDNFNKDLITNFDYAWVINGTKFDLYRFDITTQTWGSRATNINKTDVTLVTAYNRYKYNGDTSEWIWEYTLNNSSFTASQWAAINSTITSAKVVTYDGYQAQINNKQDTLTPGSGISISNNVISATPEWGDISGTLSSQTDLQNALDAKQNELTAGSGISITNDEISATPEWGDIGGTLADQSDLQTVLGGKQDNLTAGNGINISGTTISATPQWGDITGTLSSQTDLQTALGGKQNTLTPGTGVNISNDVISVTPPVWGNITGVLSNQTDLQTALGSKQDTLTAGSGISLQNGNINTQNIIWRTW